MNYFKGKNFPTLKPLTFVPVMREDIVGECKSECDAIGLLHFFPRVFLKKIRVLQTFIEDRVCSVVY
jgi:hypothetical protein